MDKPETCRPVTFPLIIAGAGIGGLTSAIALADKGFEVILCEREFDLAEVGAGLQLSPNATRVLDHLGVLEPVSAVATKVRSIDLRSASSGSSLLSLPTSKAAGIGDAPYLALHRADLQTALLEKARESHRIHLLTGHVFADARQNRDGIEAEFMSNNRLVRFEGSAIIGADGVWSQVRNLVNGSAMAKHSGYMAWRATLPIGDIASGILADCVRELRVSAFLAPGAHLVAYPLRGGSLVNLVLITPGTSLLRGYDIPVELELLDLVISQFEPGVGETLASIQNWRSWPLNGVAPEGKWVDGRIALLGDAAHAMTPFAAQGAAMAIEDAAILASRLARSPNDPVGAFADYEKTRKGRVASVVARGRFNRFAYHASGPVASARDLVFRLRGESLLRQLDWLYGYDATSA